MEFTRIGFFLILLIARLAGAVNLTMIEPVLGKRQLALERGADHALDPRQGNIIAQALEITNGRGFDTVIEVSGAPSACSTAIGIAARGACVELLATYAPNTTLAVPLTNSYLREVTLITGVCMSPHVLPRTVAIAPKLDLGRLVTLFDPEQYEEGFDAQSSGDSVKTVFAFHADQEVADFSGSF